MTTLTSHSTASAGKSLSAGSDRIFNFSAGPGCLPDEVVKQAQQDLWNIAGSGIGIMEHSHRGKVFDKVLAEAEADFRKISNLPTSYKVLFLTGGATTQNWMVPANLLPQDGTADYLVTGYWAEKSAEQAKLYGKVNLAFDGKPSNHTFVPKQSEIKFSSNPAYVHFCSNNTIYGTEFHTDPVAPKGVPLVCDMSSDIYSRPCDLTKYGLTYAGAQKNLGAAGTTIVVIHEGLLDRKPRELPLMAQYRVHAKDESRHNTPPAFNIYVCGLVFKWILKEGGLEVIGKRNAAKAKLIYDVLDGSKFFKGHARPDSRSLMNITFRTPSDALDELFIKEAGKAGMDGLKGHRATGGMRASVYNAFPMKGAEAMASFMKEFERKNG